jgi:hypothetical protein
MLTISGDPLSTTYHLDRFGAASQIIAVAIQPPRWNGKIGFDDGVPRPDPAVRLDVIATGMR